MARPPAVRAHRRAYAHVEVEATSAGFALRLDARGARTPAGNVLVAPTRALGELLAAEWAAQAAEVVFAAMPATRLAFTALDRTAHTAADAAREIARYADADVLCYFAEGPSALVEAEVRQWTPILDWAREALDLDMVRVAGVIPKPQPAQTLARAEALAAELEPFALTGLAFCAALFGSAVLAFAVQRGQLTAAAAFDLSRLDEAFQAERWGEDAEAAARTAGLRAEADLAGRWLAALREP